MTNFGPYEFFLLVYCVVAAWMFVIDSQPKFRAVAGNRPITEIGAIMKDYEALYGKEAVAQRRYEYVFGLISFFLEPVLIYMALRNDIGNQLLGAIMLGIILSVPFIFAYLATRSKMQPASMTFGGSNIAYKLRKWIYALPTLYLWYVLFVSFGWI